MTRLYRISGSALQPVPEGSLQREEDLYSWIEQHPELLGSTLLVIGKEVRTDYGKYIDLLALDEQGEAVIIELKRDRTPRDVIGQALDYASWVSTLSPKDLQDIAERHLKGDLGAAFQERFGTPLPEVLNRNHSMLIIASGFDASSERIVRYLSETHGVPINTAFFKVFSDGERQFVATDWLLDQDEVENRRDVKRQAAPTAEALRGRAEERGASDLVDICRQLNRPPVTEEPAATYGGSFRYWFNGKMIVGVNVSGQRRQAPDGTLDVWTFVPKLAELFGIDAEAIRTTLAQEFETVLNGPAEFILRLRSSNDAERLVGLIHKWVSRSLPE